MLQITPNLMLDEREIEWEFVRSSGAGGQNVNKVSSAAQLRFDIAQSPSLPPEIKARLLRLAGKRANAAGVLLLKAQSFRTQERNRQDALERLAELIRQAAPAPILRRTTRPTHASQRRRLEAKRHQSERKQQRSQANTLKRFPARDD